MPDSPNPSPTQEVERFDPQIAGATEEGFLPMDRTVDGEWVRFEDHQRLLQAGKKETWDRQEARIQEYAEANTFQKHRIRELEAQLQAEVEKREEVEGERDDFERRYDRSVQATQLAQIDQEAAESKLSSAVADKEEAQRLAIRRKRVIEEVEDELEERAEGDDNVNIRIGFDEALQLLRDKGTEQGERR